MPRFKILLSVLFLFMCSQHVVSAATYNSVPSPVDSVDNAILVTANNVPITVYKQHTRHPDKAESLESNYVSIYTDDPIVDIKVSIPNKNIDAAVVRSAGKNYLPTIQNGSLSFSVYSGVNYHVDLNPYPKTIYFFVNRATVQPSNIENVTSYGVVPNFNGLQTAKIQSLIDTAPAGKTIYFPSGVYRTGTLKFRRSNISLYLDRGAVILGSDNHSDYDGALIVFENASNIKLFGAGILDANGMITYSKDSSGDEVKIRGINIFDSSDITIEGLMLKNSNSWGVHSYRTNNIALKNFKVFSGKDGIDPDSSTNFTAENMFIESIDDGVAVKSRDSGRPTNTILIKDSIVRSIGATALKVGTENRANISNVSFTNCDVLYSDRGLHVLLRDSGVVSNVTYNDIRVFNTAGLPIFIDKPTGGSGGGTVSNIKFEDITVYTNSRILFSTIKSSLLYGSVTGLTAIISKPPERYDTLIDTDNYNKIDLSGVKIYWLGNKSYYRDAVGDGFKSVSGVQEFLTDYPSESYEEVVTVPKNSYDVNKDNIFNILDVIELLKLIFT